MNILKYSMVLVLAFSLWGCGKGNSSAPITVDPVTKKAHSDPNWLARTHRATTLASLPTCAGCHGGDFKGGISGVGCLQCHPNGPANGGPPHGIGTGYEDPNQHGGDAKLSLFLCGTCHGGGKNQPFTTITNSTVMPQGCETCHFKPGDPTKHLAHPYGWIPGRGMATTSTHSFGAQDFILSCGLCHGANLDGVGGIAPSCTPATHSVPALAGVTCHFTRPVNASGVDNGCVSCHGGFPVGPTGNAFPNTANAHPKHTALPNVTCATCHLGAGIRSTFHSNGTANIIFTDTQAGATASFDSAGKTCSNVTCHALNTTPAWNSASAGLGCRLCHTATLPATAGNSLTRHNNHLNIAGLTCDACHNDGPAVPTHTTGVVVVGSPLPAKYNENGLTATYDATVTVQKCTNVSCHGGKATTFPVWTAAAVFNQSLCLNCHTVQAQPGVVPSAYVGPYIGPFSGNNAAAANNLHNSHFFYIGGAPVSTCPQCHVVSNPSHFANIQLGRRTLPRGFAKDTIVGTEIRGYTFDSVTQTSSCLTNDITLGGNCHVTTEPRSWY